MYMMTSREHHINVRVEDVVRGKPNITGSIPRLKAYQTSKKMV